MTSQVIRLSSARIHSGPALPRRVRPYAKTQQPTPAWLRLLLGRPLAPSVEEYQSACAALRDGDPAMDRLLDWMLAYGFGKARVLFDQAIAEGIDALTNAPAPLQQFFRAIEQPPDWLDWQLIEEGVAFTHRSGASAAYVLRDLSLMGGYLLSGFNHSLVMTGALNTGTARRVAETGKWWMDCTEPGGLRRFGAGFASTLQVRMVHALVRRQLASRADWDADQHGLPLNQIDMASTYLGFSVVMLGGLRKLGIPITPRESRAVMQLWSYACWLMGVEPHWLRLREQDAAVLLHHTIMTQSPPDWTSRELGRALSQEPLARSYSHFTAIRQQWAYHKHLSISRYFLGADKLPQLGLPTHTGSWYPLITLAPRCVAYTSQRLSPWLRQRQQRRGRAAQKALLASMFGSDQPQVMSPPRASAAGGDPQ